MANPIATDCTPKAISHRLNNIRNSGKMTNSATNTPTKATPNKKTPVKTPASGARGRGRPSKPKVTVDESSPLNDDEVGASPTLKRKRGGCAKSTPAVENDDEEDNNLHGASKKIKTEFTDPDDLSVGSQFVDFDDHVYEEA